MATDTFDGPTNTQWTCPAGVTSVDVECWGQGGNGGFGTVNNGGGGGGGGGAYVKSTGISVTPGNNYDVKFSNSATLTAAANAHTTVTTGWTNPSNAFASTFDTTYATAAPAKNSTVDGDFGFANVASSDIPDGATISAVRMKARFKLSATVTGGIAGIQPRNNGVNSGTEGTTTSLTDTTVSVTMGTVTLSDLRSASTLLKARCRGTKGNTNTALTVNLDAVWMEVDWNLNGAFFGTYTVVALNGTDGANATAGGAGGAGGSATNSTGTTKFAGGSGGNGFQTVNDGGGGGGGSSGGTAATGGNGSSTSSATGGAGGTITGGGSGGTGATATSGATVAATSGSSPGGGGGGGGYATLDGQVAVGNGSNGRVSITYTGVAAVPYATPMPQLLAH